jgi:hypothetical protein
MNSAKGAQQVSVRLQLQQKRGLLQLRVGLLQFERAKKVSEFS